MRETKSYINLGILRLLGAEMRFRRTTTLLCLAAVAAAVAGTLLGTRSLAVFDRETARTLGVMSEASQAAWARFQDEMRKDMLKLGFNLMIAHRDYNLSAPEGAAALLPEDYVERLARAGLAEINHVLPFLEQALWWPEQRRWITLVGTAGEVHIKNPGRQTPMLNRVAPGSAILGHRIHESLGLRPGDVLTITGHTFRVQECLPSMGFRDDEKIWIELAQAQALMRRPGQITGMVAVDCLCSPQGLLHLRARIAELLPDTQLIEDNARMLTRAEVRGKSAQEADAAFEREKRLREALRARRRALARIMAPGIALGAALLVGLLIGLNVRARRGEIALLRAVGLSATTVLGLFVGKGAVLGLIGGLLGALGAAAVTLAGADTGVGLDRPLIALCLLGAIGLATVASLAPAWAASRIEPAKALSRE